MKWMFTVKNETKMVENKEEGKEMDVIKYKLKGTKKGKGKKERCKKEKE